jgi:drug/metabolite transporter (DMT)-like permease
VEAIALALGASLAWGLADFFGPLKGRTLGALRVLFYVQLSGLITIAIVVAVRGRGPESWTALLAVPAAISGTLGLYAYYRGVAVGAISIVAPIAGVSAVIPVAVGIASGDRPSGWQGRGHGVRTRRRLPRLAGAGSGDFPSRRRSRPGLLAALGFGSYFPPMHAAGNADFWWASLFFRTTSTLVILSVIAIRRPSLSIERRHLPPLALVGIGDMLGNLLFAAASTTGLVSVTSVLASMYPIVTVVMARLVLDERVARSQESGIVLTLAGVALISAG